MDLFRIMTIRRNRINLDDTISCINNNDIFVFSDTSGGYISAVGIGLSCPEWPFCPNGVLPSEEYLVEWIYGLVNVTVSVLAITTMVACIINKKSDSKIKITSSLVTASIVTPVILSALVIDLKLHVILVAAHLGMGVLLISMMILTTLFAFRISRNPPVV